MRLRLLLCGLLTLLGIIAAGGAALGSAKSAALSKSKPLSNRPVRASYAKLPLSFVPNRGQMNRRVRYSAQAAGASFYFTSREAVFSFTKSKAPTMKNKAPMKASGIVLGLSFVGANPRAGIRGQARMSGKVNYLIGNDRARWHTNLPTYGAVVYHDLWPGIDLRFRGATGRLKYEFLIQPGARVRDVRLAYRGAQGVSVDPGGNLVIKTSRGRLIDSRPVSYQVLGGKRVAVPSRFALGPARGAYSFAVSRYDRHRPLVIDPGLVYSTYLGGSDDDVGAGIAVDSAGRAYVTGTTFSTNFPTTPGALKTTGDPAGDVFITKLNSSGNVAIYSTLLGGTSTEFGNGIAIDSSGRAYVTGTTFSSNFPTTPGAFDTTGDVFGDAFVTKLNSAGNGLVYSTYLGGNQDEGGFSGSQIAIDSAGRAYVTGYTGSANFPVKNAFQPTYAGGGRDGFVTKFNSAGTGLLYSTYLGGTDDDSGESIAVDSAGKAYVSGVTRSTSFPVSPGAYQTTNGGYYDAFVTKLNTNASGPASRIYSTYLGGLGGEAGNGIAIDSGGKAYLTGYTGSLFDTTPGAYQTVYGGGPSDAFVTKFNSSGSALVYSTYLGGLGQDDGFGIAVDSAGQAHATGDTGSPNFPTTPDGYQQTNQGGYNDAFVTKLNSSGSNKVYSSYLGGPIDDAGLGIALDWAGKVYLTGYTSSVVGFPTKNAFQPTYAGGAFLGDAFVTKLDVGARHEGGCDRNDDSDHAEHQELDRMNHERSAAMLPPLTLNTTSSNVSRAHGCDEREHGDVGERGSDGSMSADRLRAAGVLFTVNAENNAVAASPIANEALASIQSDLANDATWRANVLNPAFTQVGIGVVYLDGVMFLTEDFTG